MMKGFGKIHTAAQIFALAVGIILLCGCGKEEKGEKTENMADSIREEDAEENISSETADYAYEDNVDRLTDVVRVEFTGENTELNGSITSIVAADTACVVAGTDQGKLFLLEPFLGYASEDFEIKSYKITDESGIGELAYANQHVAYGQGGLVSFEITEEYEEPDAEMLSGESMALPDYGYAFENVKETALPEMQNLLLLANEGEMCVYLDKNGQIGAANKGTAGLDVDIRVDDGEEESIVVSRGIYQFVLTDDGRLLYISNADLYGSFDGTVKSISLNCQDFTDRADGRITDIYNLQNYEDCCYAVDENSNIYYLEADFGGETTAERIACFENGRIADIQGFAGQNTVMLIRNADGAYFYHDDSGMENLEALSSDCKKAVLLMDGSIMALGKDGWLSIIPCS